ncbi:YheC/YheD family endospore coat-associated protein [Paenibacillus arenilitoris]|uniref:YheC/YheD family protein n=1 Tax=Paenibacillus arenilitoris TaxID=2772299 RepID=A0A927H9A5_9BACL|nr:YheC/YheD family protein [Paenibacillus arenilitoris]MBD2872915.1 YheC/YheD family protein [Paenibacillus arenilitoris]
MSNRTIVLGIAVAAVKEAAGAEPAMPEPAFCRALSRAGAPLGIGVYVFAPDGYEPETGVLHAFRLEGGRWAKRAVPLPDVVYDRCFSSEPGQGIRCRSALAAMAERKPHIPLNGRLPGKLAVYDSLKDDPALSGHLPSSLGFRSAEQLLRLAGAHEGGIVLKPSSGMQGRGIVHIKRGQEGEKVRVNGRTRQNRPFAAEFEAGRPFARWAARFIGRRTYFVQPYLELSGADGKPFDVRALLQKGGLGDWTLSGIAVRSGQAGSLTSNLHGGGAAEPAAAALAAKFGGEESERLLEQIHTISKQTAIRLEGRFGRFAELGLDFGIEPDGKLWLLEANTKPGRSSFRMIGDERAERLSIERPLLYARYLSSRQYTSFAANESVNGRRVNAKFANPLRPFNVQEVHR